MKTTTSKSRPTCFCDFVVPGSFDKDYNLYAWYEKELRTYTWAAKYADPQLPAMAYIIPNVRFDSEDIIQDELVHSSAWRGVTGHGQFFRECFVDEIAAALKKDPYEFRKELLDDRVLMFLPVMPILLSAAAFLLL